MQLDLLYYKNNWHGTLTDEEFAELQPVAEMIVESFVLSCIARQDIAPLSQLRGDYRNAVCAEIDFLSTIGGRAAVFGGQNQVDLKTVKTENFEFTYSDETRQNYDFQGMPLSPFAKTAAMSELRVQGYLSLKVKQCLRRDF